MVNWWNVTVGSVNVRPLMAFMEEKETAWASQSTLNQLFSSRISWFSHTGWTIYAWVGSIVLFFLAQIAFPCGKEYAMQRSGTYSSALDPPWWSWVTFGIKRQCVAVWWARDPCRCSVTGRNGGATVKSRQLTRTDGRTDTYGRTDWHGQTNELTRTNRQTGRQLWEQRQKVSKGTGS